LFYQGGPTPADRLNLRVLDISPDGKFIVVGATSQMTPRLRWTAAITPETVTKLTHR
jgi:hypothetical protein